MDDLDEEGGVPSRWVLLIITGTPKCQALKCVLFGSKEIRHSRGIGGQSS